MTVSIPLGAPGVSFRSPEALRALTDVRLDVCAFAGVAPRGPARLPRFELPWEPPRGPDEARPPVRYAVPVAVDSWEQYRRLFGSFEGRGLLPYAVASFFENGGRQAWIVRIVHRTNGDLEQEAARGRAWALFGGLRTTANVSVRVRANNEGTWGNRLSARLSFTTRPLPPDERPADKRPGDERPGAVSFDRIRIGRGTTLPVGTLLRLRLGDGTPVLRRITAVTEQWDERARQRERWAVFDHPSPGEARSADVVEGRLEIRDGDPLFAKHDAHFARQERYEGVGLCAAHPRWLARVLWEQSELLMPTPEWLDSDLSVPPSLDAVVTTAFEGGTDYYREIDSNDFFDPVWTPADEYPSKGIHVLADVAAAVRSVADPLRGVRSRADVPEPGLLVVPDLYSPRPLPERASVEDPGPMAGPVFAPCVPPAKVAERPDPMDDLDGLSLDPRAKLDEIIALQLRVVELADQLGTLTVLLDVPPGLDQGRILKWRARFDSAYAGAYHPWLKVTRPDDERDVPILIPPSAVAAGIIALQENAFGLHHGPANVLAAGVVDVEERVPPPRHDVLHQANVNVYLPERDGVRLTAGRSLARDPAWRQLSVRRLVTMVKLVLDRQMQWAVFEPNGPALRGKVVQLVEAFLRRLFRLGALAGGTEREAFFVRCDESVNPRAVVDQGRFVCEVGIAPVEPLEFVVVEIVREGDGTLRIQG